LEFTPLEREQPSGKPALTAEQIESLCARAFGKSQPITAARELGGGTFNATYRVSRDGLPDVILRVAPASQNVAWDEQWLMRKEHAIQPYFAPVAHLMPKTILADFTHQLIDHDYLFQTFIEGERWDDIHDQLTPDEETALWSEFGRLLKTIHSVQGESFGWPHPGQQFPKWSVALSNRMEQIQGQVQLHGLELAVLSHILDIVRAHPQSLDEITRPSLLHGNLWLFNILIRRTEGSAQIVGLLDADRAWWGDPAADWTMFILANAPDEPQIKRVHGIFWKAYGKPENSPGQHFRKQVYEAMHAGTAFLWANRHGDQGTINLAREKLASIERELGTLVN
jgi:aminoglycoside phosphotransferase (APT) family kinase protein